MRARLALSWLNIARQRYRASVRRALREQITARFIDNLKDVREFERFQTRRYRMPISEKQFAKTVNSWTKPVCRRGSNYREYRRNQSVSSSPSLCVNRPVRSLVQTKTSRTLRDERLQRQNEQQMTTIYVVSKWHCSNRSN